MKKELEISLMSSSKSATLILLTNKRSLEYQRQLQERMLGDAAHELKTPLTALMLLGDRLDNLVKKKDRPLIKRLRKEILRLKLMVNDLLELSRLVNASSVEDELKKRINLEEIVLNGWNTLKPLADKKKLDLVNTSKTNSLIEGNSEKLYRVVFNLLDNAISFAGNIKLSQQKIKIDNSLFKRILNDGFDGITSNPNYKMLALLIILLINLSLFFIIGNVGKVFLRNVGIM